jgi:hypothetical protein
MANPAVASMATIITATIITATIIFFISLLLSVFIAFTYFLQQPPCHRRLYWVFLS